MTEKPLISFVLLTCDQAAFVEEALQSALQQTYRPLEIIVSDDASIDGTWDIVRRVTEGYTGPHELRLLRHSRRQGIVGNFNAAVSEATGKLIVVGAGDDRSMPRRVAAVVSLWNRTDRTVSVFCSRYLPIDQNGAEVAYPNQELDGYLREGRRWF